MNLIDKIELFDSSSKTSKTYEVQDTLAQEKMKELQEQFEKPVQEQVDDYLNRHPELTTTVQDNSITRKKLSKDLTIKKFHVVNSLRELNLNESLEVGDYCETYGFNSYQDGRAGVYKITNEKSPYSVSLSNGLFAEVVITEGVLDIYKLDLETPFKGDFFELEVNQINLGGFEAYFEDVKIFFDCTIANGTLLHSGKEFMISSGNSLKFKDIVFNSLNLSVPTLILNGDSETLMIHCVAKNVSSLGLNKNEIQFCNKSGGSLIVNNCEFKDIFNSCLFVRELTSLLVTNSKFFTIGNQSSHREGSAIYASKCKKGIVSENEFDLITDSCIYFDNSEDEQLIVTNNVIKNCGKEAIKNQTTGRKTIISNNVIENVSAQGIVCNSLADTLIISNNIIKNFCFGDNSRASQLSAILVNSSKRVVVSNNIINNSQKKDACGISVQKYSNQTENSEHVIVSTNIVSDTSGPGIKIQGCNNSNVSNNTVINPSLFTESWKCGIYLQQLNGVANSNIVKSEDFSGYCTKLSNFTLQFSVGSYLDKITTGTSVTFKVGTGTSKEYFEKIITTEVVEVSDDGIVTVLSSLEILDDLELMYFIENPLELSYGLRMYSDVSVCCFGNTTNASSFVRVDVPQSVNTVPDGEQLSNFNLVLT